MLDAGVILKTVVGEIFAVSAALKATVRHFGHDWDVGIDPDASEVKSLGHPHGSTMVLSPDR